MPDDVKSMCFAYELTGVSRPDCEHMCMTAVRLGMGKCKKCKKEKPMLKKALSNKVKVIRALCIEEAKKKFAANRNIVAIVMDACVPGNLPNTQPLVKKLREKFTGPMIAASSAPEFSQALVDAGCSHKCDKDFVPDMVRKILGL